MATFSSGAGPYTLILNVNEVGGSADVGSNTSKVSWSLQMRADSAYCQWNPGPGDFEVRINGGIVWSAQNPSLWYGGIGGTLTLASGTTTVGHDSNGAKTVYCEGKYIANSTANYLPNSSTCGGNLTLTTIPRASSFSSISGNTIGGSQTINIDRKSSSFTHNLWYRIGSGSWVSIATGVGTSKTWTLPKSLNNQIPNATSLTLTYLLRTYNGGSQIGGDVIYNFKVNYSGEKPTAGSVSITYTNLFNNKFIANYSTATIKYSGYAGVYGSTVKSAQVIFNGSWKETVTYDTGKLTAGTHTFQGVVTDSRNNTSYTSQQSFTCYQINNPIISINAYRSDAEGNASPSGTYITIIPTYSAHDPVGGNSIKSNSFTCTSLMTTGTAIESGSKKILSNAAVDSEYIISGTVTDQLGRSSATSIKVGTAFTILDVRQDEKGIAFGKYSTGADKFEVAWDAYFDGKLNGYSTGVTDYGDPNRKIQIGYAGAGLNTSNLSHIAGYTDNGTKIKDVSKSVLQSWLGISNSDLLNKLYPVGAIYLTWNNNNPGNFLGGTWVRMAEGRGLFGVGRSTGRNGIAANVGEHEEFGDWKHRLTVDEMPPHGHKLYARGGSTAQTSSPFAENKPITQGSNSYGFNVSETGGGKDFYIVPPYIGIYVWRRTA